MYSTADPKSDENSDETLNLVIVTELVKLLECREDTIGKLVLVVVLQVPNDKNDEFRPKNAVFRFKLKEINFEAVQTCIVEEFLFGDFKTRNSAQNKLAWPPIRTLNLKQDWSSYLVVPKFNQLVVKIS